MENFPNEIEVDELRGSRVLLRALSEDDADALYRIIDGSRAFLARHLPWPDDCRSAEDVAARLDSWDMQSQMGNGACWGIFDAAPAAGAVLPSGAAPAAGAVSTPDTASATASFACESAVPRTPVLAGCIVVGYIQWANRSASVSYWLGERFTGRGLATEALRLVCRKMFSLGVNRLELSVSVGNSKSAAVARRAGFVEEGLCREYEWINGSFEDHLRFSRLSRDPEPGSR